MSRSVPEWIGKTDDASVPPRVRRRVFLAHGGICHISKRKIMPGEDWQCDHVKPLIQGGENREANLAPAFTEKHREKTAGEVDAKSKEARIWAKHHGTWPASPFKIRSRGFTKRPTPMGGERA